MEAAQATAAEGAILWLAQTILGTLEPGDLDAWLHRAGLAGAIGELKSEVERMETVVNGVKGRAVGNKPLARSLARVKELMYDADDVVDELDYCRLKRQVQGVMLAPAIEPEGMVGDGDREGQEQLAASASTGIPNNSGRKNRSETRDYFHIIPSVNKNPAKAKCIGCGTELTWGHGTSALRKHLKSCKNKRSAIEEMPNRPRPSAGDSVQNGATISTNDSSEGRKRMRIEYNVATTTHLSDKAKFLKRIQIIALELQRIRGDVIKYLEDSAARSDQYQINNSDSRVRTSSSLPGKVYGRDVEKNKIIWTVEAAESDNITVLPIVGIVGLGKTALAKLVYNDQRVARKFERIWVWVSSIFDEVRVTREILYIVTLASHEGSRNRECYEGVSNYSKLLEVLKKHMTCLSKKFLLVLDDVCDCMDNSQWEDLMDALGSSCTKGNVIIVTVRNLSVAKRLGTVKPVELGALKDDDFWSFFKACAFGDNNYQEHLDIGRQIVAKLKGNPLAAKDAAKMLRDNPTIDHWKSILKNGVWESLQVRGGIVTALKISYYQLPYNLQQCFLVCSIFPNDHEFYIDGLVYMWISLGFVKSVEIGRDYINALVNLGFFEQVQTEDDSILHHQQCYVMRGIMHEFARLVSMTEFATIDGLQCKEVLPTIRHFSILIDSVYHKDEHGIVLRNVKFEEKMKSIISSVRRLRTLILIGHYDSLFFQLFHTFMCSLVNCTHLRYLKLQNKGSNEVLPISLSKFYHLEVLDVGQPVIVDGTSDLVNMRNLVLPKGACGACSPAWFACLQTIHLEDCDGWEILPYLERLSCLTKLKLRNMPEVTELFIPSLQDLVLIDMPELDRCFSNSVRELNSSLRVLEIRRCWELKVFPLFESCEKFGIEQKSWLANVSELTIDDCPHLMVSNPLPPSSSFCKLSIKDVSTLPTMEGSSNGELKIGFYSDQSSIEFLDDKILSFYNLRTITQLQIVGCKNLLSISLEGFRQLICLKRLEIIECAKLFSSDVPSTHTHEEMEAANPDALPSLECLSIRYCGITGEWLSVMLQHVRALEELHLEGCEKISGITGMQECRDNMCEPCYLQLHSCTALKKLTIRYCESLDALEDIESLGGLRYLEVLGCPGLPQCLESVSMQGYKVCPRLERLWIDDYSFLTIPFCKHLISLQCLRFMDTGDCAEDIDEAGAGLTCEQEAALQLLTSLHELIFDYCYYLSDLPVGLHSLSSLKRLDIFCCPWISRLPEKGLPPSLEELVVWGCSKELTEQCRMLATSKLHVKINGNYVN